MNEEILKIIKENIVKAQEQGGTVVSSGYSSNNQEEKTYELGLIFGLDEDYPNKAHFCNSHGYMIKEIEKDSEGNRQFQICEVPGPSEIDLAYNEQYELRAKLKKYKEDVEQVELFGMEREDYQDKKSQCAEIIKQLREIDAKIKELEENK